MNAPSLAQVEEKLKGFRPSPAFPRRLVFERQVLPFAEDEKRISLLAPPRRGDDLTPMLGYLLQKEVCWVEAEEKDVARLIKEHYGVG
ncbi:MAG: hypothetical protein ACOYMV_09110, partial [Verrucomicrobiia bacterium]